MTLFPHILVIAVPNRMMPQANQLALVMGESKYDDQTFKTASWVASDGTLVSVQSTRVKEGYLDPLGASALSAPVHSPEVNLSAAEEARSVVSMSGPARYGAIVYIVDKDYDTAMAELDVSELEL